MQRSTIIVTLVTAVIGVGLFQVKYKVMLLEKEYRTVQNRIKTTRESIRVLKAEWAHLNDPKSLQQLAQRHMDIAPVGAKQLISLQSVAGAEAPQERAELDELITGMTAKADEDHD